MAICEVNGSIPANLNAAETPSPDFICLATATGPERRARAERKDRSMKKTLQLLGLSAALAFAFLVAPAQASAKCDFSKKEKIAMVSWIAVIPGAVITGLGCRRDLFQNGREKRAAMTADKRSQAELQVIDRRKRGS